jgi:hypothetical protein
MFATVVKSKPTASELILPYIRQTPKAPPSTPLVLLIPPGPHQSHKHRRTHNMINHEFACASLHIPPMLCRHRLVSSLTAALTSAVRYSSSIHDLQLLAGTPSSAQPALRWSLFRDISGTAQNRCPSVAVRIGEVLPTRRSGGCIGRCTWARLWRF